MLDNDSMMLNLEDRGALAREFAIGIEIEDNVAVDDLTKFQYKLSELRDSFAPVEKTEVGGWPSVFYITSDSYDSEGKVLFVYDSEDRCYVATPELLRRSIKYN